jgi:hypothetical protein
MKTFKVSTGVIKKANQLLINSNKLEGVFYNIGNKFILTKHFDYYEAKKILERNYIKLYSC